MIRVAIIAGSAIVHAGLASVISSEDGLQIVTEDDAGIDVLVTDVDDSSQSGEITDRDSTVPVVVLMDGVQPAWLAAVVRTGVRAVLPRSAKPVEIVAAIRGAAAGLISIEPAMMDELLATARTSASAVAAVPGEALTPREIEVLRMISDGASNKIIAGRLAISDHTVKFHVASIMSKLAAGSRTEAVTIGIRRGLVPL